MMGQRSSAPLQGFTGATAPSPGSPAELAAFAALQAQLPDQFRNVFPDPAAERTVVVVPSLSLDQEVLASVSGAHHYEERMLCLLLLLRLPRTRLIYLTSKPVPDAIIDYYLHLLPGIPSRHARSRLTLLSCHDAAPIALTGKILERPRLMDRIRHSIPDPAAAHLTCFNVSPLERSLAVQLGIPVYGCDPDLLALGTKSGSRRLFREAGVPIPEGFEDLGDEQQLADALATLKGRSPGLRRAVVKLNDGFSGEGNALFDFTEAPDGRALNAWIRGRLPDLAFEASGMTWETYRKKVHDMGAIVETFIEGHDKRSPSAQYRIDPLGEVAVISTHDQELGGASGQIFQGCRFPADDSYRLEIQEIGLRAATLLRRQGVLGRFAVDFISTRQNDGWKHFAIEVNLRKGGTTHPFLMLQFLSGGHYDPESGLYYTPAGQPRFYFATDNLEASRYRGLSPEDLIDIAVLNGLHSQQRQPKRRHVPPHRCALGVRQARRPERGRQPRRSEGAARPHRRGARPGGGRELTRGANQSPVNAIIRPAMSALTQQAIDSAPARASRRESAPSKRGPWSAWRTIAAPAARAMSTSLI